MDLTRLERILSNNCRLGRTEPLLVGVSGGPDSLCLLDILLRLKFQVIAAHFDHRLRPESQLDADYARRIAERYGIPFIHGFEEVKKEAKQNKITIEEAARKARYRFLFDAAKNNQAQAVAVAHTADDQVETVFMHLLRGSGLTGLKGMSYRSESTGWDPLIPLVRPLLGVWREQIIEYCDTNGLQPLFDSSNNDIRFSRNRVRHELIPHLEEYNPQLKNAIWRMAVTLEGDLAVVQDALHRIWPFCCMEANSTHILLCMSELQKLLPGMQRVVFRQAIAQLCPGLSDLNYPVIEKAMKFLEAPTHRRQVELVGGLKLSLLENNLLISKGDWPKYYPESPQLAEGNEFLLDDGSSMEILHEWVITGEIISIQDLPENITDPYQAWLDARFLRLPLQVRQAGAGDRFQPLGMGGHSVKVSDLWINAKIPRIARKAWPIIFSEGRIAWIPGFRPAYFCRIQPSTQLVFHLNCRKKIM